MKSITRKELLDKLNTYLEKKISIKISGNINLITVLEKFKYEVSSDIIKMQDDDMKNNIDINLNDINFISIDENKIICYLNDDKDTVIEIKSEL